MLEISPNSGKIHILTDERAEMNTRLQEFRKKAGWKNADDFARHIGIPPKTYRNYEQGIRNLNLEIASELCNELNCTLDDLIDKPEIRYSVVPMPNELDDDEQELIELYRSLPPRGKHAVLVGLRDFAGK